MNSENPTELHSNDQPKVPQKSPWIFRFFLRVFITLFFLILLLVGTGFFIGYYYQNDVKDYIVSELNKQLNTQVIVDGKDIDFTVLKNFPLASVDFKNVKALDAGAFKKKDTLFKAGEISMQFNIVDVFKKKYHVKKIKVSNVDLRIRIDKNGNDNYHFWKETNDSSSTSFSFALEKIILENVNLDYKNSKTKQSFDGSIKNSKLSGEFSNTKYTLNAIADMHVGYIRSDSTNFLRKKDVHTEFDLNVDNELNSYKIGSGKLKIENMLFDVFGSVINSGNESLLNLGIKGKDMDIKSVLSLIPNKYKGKINDYESNGEFYFDALIQGSVGNGKMPQITADFGVKSADITKVKDGIELKNVTLKGHYSNGNKDKSELSVLDLVSFSANINQGTISGELKMKNLDHPAFNGKIIANTTLEEVQRFIKVDTIETINGELKLNASFSCDEWKGSSGNFENVIVSGDLSVLNANIKIENDALDFVNINGDFKFDNNDLAVNQFSGKVSGSDFELKGVFRNMIGYIFKENQDINIEATLNSTNINLNELLANKEENSTSKDKYKLKFSEHINVNLNTEIQHLQFRKFEASNIKGIVKLKDKKLVLDPVTLSTMNGTITTSGLVDGSDSTKLLVTCFSDINRISITKMFEEFENFGQTNITSKNIKGVATAKIQFASVLSPELQMDMDKLYAGVDMNIDNGELNNVESMKSLSRFIELKELENIRFATLKNQIEIKKQVITIPKMEIKSTAINLTVSGTHTFNNDINYKIKLSLNELLSKKAKAAKKQNDEFGEVADDGLGRTNIFLSMTGNISDPVIKYDSKGAIQNVRQDLKVEKQNLKSILKDEFGLFKKDSTLNKKDNLKKEDQTKFHINWDEADKKEEKKELKPPKKKEEDDF
jgi:hypothetical protein